jgi:hypothetical protein
LEKIVKRFVHQCFAEGFQAGLEDRKRGAVKPSHLPPWPASDIAPDGSGWSCPDYVKAFKAGYIAGWTLFGTGESFWRSPEILLWAKALRSKQRQ